MTTQKQYDDFMAGDHTPEEIEAFYNHAINNYEPDAHWTQYASLGMIISMLLIMMALAWAFFAVAVPYVLHIPPVSTTVSP